MAKKWIQKAIKKKGSLRASAKRMGLIKGDQKLSSSALATMRARANKSGNTKMLRRVALARTLKKM
jgi:hypothetical protein